MAKHLLSDRQCAAARPASGSGAHIRYLNDGDGLRLQVRPDGAKYWMFRFRVVKPNGSKKETTHGLGRYPDVGLAEARQKAERARGLVDEGKHPTSERRVRKAQLAQAREATFKVVAEEWLERMHPEWSDVHYERNEGLLRRALYKDLGALPIDSITEPMLLKTLRKTYDAGRKESARRARAVAAQVFQYAKDTHRAPSNPARELAESSALAKPAVKHFAAMKKGDVGPFLRALTESQTPPVTRGALLLMLYTGLRDYSLRAAQWPEIDLEAATWIVPAERMKSGREHRVPLPRQAVEVLGVLEALTKGEPDSFVFASTGKEGHLAENTLRQRLHELGFKVTAHGLRSLMTDVLNEEGFNADAIERQLDHVAKGVRGAYLRSDFFEYRRTMLQWYADWADAQRKKLPVPALPSNVIPISRVA